MQTLLRPFLSAAVSCIHRGERVLKERKLDDMTFKSTLTINTQAYYNIFLQNHDWDTSFSVQLFSKRQESHVGLQRIKLVLFEVTDRWLTVTSGVNGERYRVWEPILKELCQYSIVSKSRFSDENKTREEETQNMTVAEVLHTFTIDEM